MTAIDWLHNELTCTWYDKKSSKHLLIKAKEMEKKLNDKKINRIEIINHATNEYPIGRMLTLFKELKDFNSIDISIQDDGRTLKIFLDN